MEAQGSGDRGDRPQGFHKRKNTASEVTPTKVPHLQEDMDNILMSKEVTNSVQTPDSTQPDSSPTEDTPTHSPLSNINPLVSTNLQMITKDLSNFRRFSARDKKRTDFFIPTEFPQRFSVMEKPFKSHSFQSVRRALNFDRLKHQVLPGEQNHNDDLGFNFTNTNDTVGMETEVVRAQDIAAGRRERSIIRDSQPHEKNTVDSHAFPVGSLIWGKLPGYDWWPGYVMSYGKKDKTGMEADDKEEDDDEEEEEEEEEVEIAWVKWYGDNQLSQLSSRKLCSFAQFTEYLSPNKIKGLYKKALFAVLKEAAKRCSKDIGSTKYEDRKAAWIFHPSLLSSWFEEMGIIRTTTEFMEEVTPPDELPQQNSPLHSPDSSSTNMPAVKNSIFTSLATSDSNNIPNKEGKGKGKGRGGQILLSSLEKELLEWGLMGFPPTGPNGFKPRQEDLVEVKVFSMGASSSEVIVKSEDGFIPEYREDRGDEGKKGQGKNKLVLVQTRSKAQFELVLQGQLDIEDICISCGTTNIVAEHPLFHGGLCKPCKESFMEYAYLFDEDGTQMYCTLCSGGNEVFMCDTPNCSKVYCGPCIEKLCGKDERLSVQEMKEWQCYMCSENSSVGAIKRREDWNRKLHELFLNDNEMQYEPLKFLSPIPAEERKPIRVLGLFDGIGTGLLVLKELGINVDVYVASEIDPDAVKVSRVQHPEILHVGAVEYITEKEVHAWGPFDLIIGGSPCNDLSIVNPARKGIYDGTGKLFFEFFRILSYAKPRPDEQRPFFWLYENVVSMRAPDKQIISRFLQCNPVVVDAREISAAHRARYFWGNFPGMNRPTIPLPGDRLTLQECLEPHCFRTAQFTKLRTITTKMNSIKQTKKAIFPVRVEVGAMGEEDDEDGDVLWCTEMERLFGFPDHYTDVANLGRCGRQRLLGKAWSVPVVRHLFSPLKDYFQSNTTGMPSSIKHPGSSTPTSLPENEEFSVAMTTKELSPPATSTIPSLVPVITPIKTPAVVAPPKPLSPEPESVICIKSDACLDPSSPNASRQS